MRLIHGVLLVVILACGCVKKPPPGEFDFIPILKGLKPDSTQGDLKTGRSDLFDLDRPIDDLRRQMPISDFNFDGHGFRYTFTPVTYPPGLKQCRITVVYDALGRGKKNACQVIVWRRSTPLSDAEQRETAKHKEESARRQQIKDGIEKSHTLSKSDADFLLKAMEEDSLSGLIAGLILGEAADAKLFPREQLVARTEKVLDQDHKTGEAVLWVRCYGGFLGLPTVSDKSIADEAHGIVLQHNSESSLMPNEQSFVKRALEDSKVQNSNLAAEILVAKRGLDPQDRSWVLGRVDEQVQKSKGKSKRYWDCVRRVVLLRNPGPAH